MKVLVLNGSPSGKNSITLQTVHYIELFFPKAEFEVLHVGQQIRSYENDFEPAAISLQGADLILFCYPVYTFLVPSQLHRFIELIRENGVDLAGKFATQITTSKHFYDTTAHRFIEDICGDLGMLYIRGLSADMDDLLGKKGQREALEFFRFVCWNMKQYRSLNIDHEEVCGMYSCTGTVSEEHGISSGEESGIRIAVVADLLEDERSRHLRELIDGFRKVCSAKCEVVNIREFPFSGGCLGCFHCASSGECIYKDGFDTFLREKIQSADAIVYAYQVMEHSMGARFKMFDDRQFCNGHRTVTMGKPVGYIVEGDLREEENLRTLMEARAEVGGNFLAGIVSEDGDTDRDLVMLARTLEYAVRRHFNMPANFYGVGGMKIFRDLIYQMQGMMKEDHRFYKEHGFYDFPQKKPGRIAGMYLVGAMMSNEKLKKKIGGKMTEGMLMPYRHVIETVKKKRNGQ